MAIPNAPISQGAKPPHTIPPSMTLRALLDARRAEKKRMSLDEAIAIVVPLCMDLQERHNRGEKLYVHPSCIAPGADGLARVNAKLALVPTNAHDRYCLAPEQQATLEPGDQVASVYAIGAILYEMVTGSHIGPGMKRPREVDPTLPEALEVLIGKAIIGDRTHRPADLGALCSAMYHIAPAKSIHPPEVDDAMLDQSAELDVDIKFSVMPPAAANGIQIPRAPSAPRGLDAGDPFGNVIVAAPSPSSRRLDDPTAQLSALKERLESDPRPRYVVNKDRMDHGPFTAVELLQQIASNTFTSDHDLRDEISGVSKPIKEWEEFAKFATHSALKRQVVAEQKEVVRAVKAEKKGGIVKLLIGLAALAGVLAVVGVWFFTRKGTRNEELTIEIDRNTGALDPGGELKGKKKPVAGPFAGGGGGVPGQPGAGGAYQGGGSSYENVLDNNNQTITMGENSGPDLTNAQLAAPLRSASFISGCGAPDDMKVTVRVAVKMGRAQGVSVSTNPPNPGVAACVDAHVRRLSWPVSAKADFVTTTY
jgi:hypothetical protein